MNNNNQPFGTLLIGVLIGSAITFVGFLLFASDTSEQASPSNAEKKPLYWVAPMDANYKRDKPGLSPMGMDLVPVFENSSIGKETGPGTISISPEVINNLGVRTTKVSYASLNSEITTVGYVKYDEDQLVHIHPRVEGWVEKLYVKASGDPVEQGAPLYEIYSPALVNAQEEMLLALDRKNQRLIRAAEDRLRALQLPKNVIDALKKTRKITQNITFYAPQKGVIDNLNIREGFFVKPGTTLMSIARLKQVWVEAEVFERQVSDLAVGIAVTMTLAYLPGKQWLGKVDYIYPSLDAKNRTVKVRLRFDNENQQLKPNMFAQVVIHTKNKKQSLLIPKEAVIRSGSSNRVVLALGEGRFKSVNVKTGRYDSSFAEILSGIEEGEEVVVSAQFLLDSESSKSSDFKRMTQDANENQETNTTQKNKSKSSATVEGVINSVMTDHRMLNISRGPIVAWGRQAATLDFMVSDELDISALNEQMKIHFSFFVEDGEFVITDIQILGDSDFEQVQNQEHKQDKD